MKQYAQILVAAAMTFSLGIAGGMAAQSQKFREIVFGGPDPDTTEGRVQFTQPSAVDTLTFQIGGQDAMELDETGSEPRMQALGSFALNAVQTFTDSDLTPDVGGGSNFATNTTTAVLTDFDGSEIESGQLLCVESAGAITFDVTSSGLKGGSTNIVTADGDLTCWLYNGTDWLLIAFMDLSDDMS